MLESRNKENIQLSVKKEQKKENKLVLIASHRPNENHKCFEYNTKTGELKLANFREEPKTVTLHEAYNICNGVGKKREVIIQKDCTYITALNEENAIKKLRKMGHVRFS